MNNFSDFSQNVVKLAFLKNITILSRLSERIKGDGGSNPVNLVNHSSQKRGDPKTAIAWSLKRGGSALHTVHWHYQPIEDPRNRNSVSGSTFLSHDE